MNILSIVMLIISAIISIITYICIIKWIVSLFKSDSASKNNKANNSNPNYVIDNITDLDNDYFLIRNGWLLEYRGKEDSFFVPRGVRVIGNSDKRICEKALDTIYLPKTVSLIAEYALPFVEIVKYEGTKSEFDSWVSCYKDNFIDGWRPDWAPPELKNVTVETKFRYNFRYDEMLRLCMKEEPDKYQSMFINGTRTDTSIGNKPSINTSTKNSAQNNNSNLGSSYVKTTSDLSTSKAKETVLANTDNRVSDSSKGLNGSSKGLKYTLTDDSRGYLVSGIGNCKDVDVVIPKVFNCLPVVGVGSFAFEGDSELKSVVIPDGVSVIKTSAFVYCNGLKNISVPSSIKRIEKNAFSCYHNESIIVEFRGTVKQWQNVDKTKDWIVTRSGYSIQCTDGTVSGQ